MISSARDLKLSDFAYELPSERIAQVPVTPRDHSRLMVLDPITGSAAHHRFHEIDRYLNAGDVLVLNATRVFPARLRGHKASGGKVELLLLSALGPRRWKALIRNAIAVGTELNFEEELSARVLARTSDGEWELEFSSENVRGHLARHGEMPLPPYVKRAALNPLDKERYQTVFARAEGSVAAPTAGFHFTPELLTRIKSRGVEIVEVVLHVSWGTFRPVRTESILEHRMLTEHYEVSESAAGRLNAARREARRIIAVGTTAVRTLESAFISGPDEFAAGSGETPLFIYPGYQFRAIDALVTNFHLPDSTPLLLACAFYAHRARRAEPAFCLRPAYEEAIAHDYRFYSYGDAMLIQ
jgi:S-adenosylmethionine:tRNA ribosyltransferase-isomerase